ncbi:MAG: transglycosylase SLT domain-containing protein [Pseudomonadota bacterium]
MAHANPNWTNERDIYQKALQALSKKKINQFNQYANQLTEYPLYQYLKYEELKTRKSSLSNQDIDDFLATYPDGPLADRIRLSWLYHLQRKNQPESFLKYYRDDKAPALQCYFLRSQIKLGQLEENKQTYINQIRDLWLVGKSQVKQCDALFAWFDRQGYLTAELIWERLGLVMSSNRTSLAKYLAKKLPVNERPRAKLWLDVHSAPKTEIRSNQLQNDDHINRKIIAHGLNRLARKDLTAAHNLWLDIKDNYAFGSDLHDEVDRSLALRAAYRHDDRAKTWMYQLPKEVYDPATAMWRTRSAIRDLDWELVLRGIAMLGDEEKAEPQWQYWKARALAEKGLRSDAESIYKKIAGERSYYGFLAADKLSIAYNIVDAPLQYDAAELEKIENSPSIIRAGELLLVSQNSDARREWNYATKKYTEKQLQVAASLAHQWQWHDYAIRTIAKGNYFDDLGIRFPMPFTSQVEKYATKRKLEPAFVYGIIRRESAFNPQARSPVGARGLMQLMPATAKEVSKKLNLKSPSRHDLYRPAFNINLGSKYIADMLRKFSGHRALASAAYNAGPHRVKAWLPEDYELPADVWVDTIPFTETREYVRAILAYTALFEWKRAQNPTRLSLHLQPVSPKP